MKGSINEQGNYVVEFHDDDLMFFSKVMRDYMDTIKEAGELAADPVRIRRYQILTESFLREAQRVNKLHADIQQSLRSK